MTSADVAPRQHSSVTLLALMMLVVPALGVPSSNVLPGTLKAALVVFFVLTAALVFFWKLRHQPDPLFFHALLCLPTGLLAYALGSMVWSHTYLAGVEAVRWMIFSVLLFLGTQVFTLSRTDRLLWGIHGGALLASVWTALQFWLDWRFFPQGAEPASTFANRNFFAEFVICTLPLSVLLLTRLRHKAWVTAVTVTIGFNLVALMMTGTRSALISLYILVPLLSAIIFRYRHQWCSGGWKIRQSIALLALLLATVASLGSIHTSNAKVLEESGYVTAIDRTLRRSLSISKADEYSEGSSSRRLIMWKSTLRMIAAHPLAGVGAGAWDVHIPRYMDAGYAAADFDFPHNEVLQLLAEYGLLGWLFLLTLVAYLLRTAYTTWADRSAPALREAPLRALTLASLLVFLLVSNAGFPWHLATTAALFALCLALLAASDVRLPGGTFKVWCQRLCPPWLARAALGLGTLSAAMALYITQQAITCEIELSQAAHIAHTITLSGRPDAAYWAPEKAHMLQLLRAGMAINPHYRILLTDSVDALTDWGDDEHASQILETQLLSRPYAVYMLAYVSYYYTGRGDFAKAQIYLQRAKALQPNAPLVLSQEVRLLMRTGQAAQAARRAKAALDLGAITHDLFEAAYALGQSQQDASLSILALQQAIKTWPDQAQESWLLLGAIYSSEQANDKAQALQAYRSAWALTAVADQGQVLGRIPPAYRTHLEQKHSVE